jgi:hypothetical protein
MESNPSTTSFKAAASPPVIEFKKDVPVTEIESSLVVRSLGLKPISSNEVSLLEHPGTLRYLQQQKHRNRTESV